VSGGVAGDPHRPLAEFFGDALVMRTRGSFNLDRVRLVDGHDGCVSRYLRVAYPAGSASQLSVREHDAPTGGAQVYLGLRTGSTDVAHLSYRVRFPAGFQFNKGGKLPGLFGGDHVAGGNVPDGTNGFSTRYMWRTGGTGVVYAYLPSSKDFGTSLGGWTWPTGRWATVQQRVRLNTPGRADGSVTVWLDGRDILRADDVLFRETAALRVDGVFFSTFFGGGDLSWASPTDQHVDFADFRVSDHYVNDQPPPGCRPVAATATGGGLATSAPAPPPERTRPPV
ncbi:polysaccharide lyase, partial [Frankia nepalensis]|uniref:polysaccharide lyase n=1 Tax=Frankia nepalensis TaxID=1836974 RepID=UPI00193435F1